MNILIIDDEANIRKMLSICLETDGHKIVCVSNFKDGVDEAKAQVFDMALVDIRLGADSGLDLIPLLLSSSPWLKIIVITAYASIDTAVEAIRRGAFDYLSKPFKPDQLRVQTRKVDEIRSLERRIEALENDIHQLHPEAELSTLSPLMQRALEFARHAAPSDAIILLQGENGTGKTLLARAIHGWSHRAKYPLSIVSCPTLSSELIESELFGHVKGAFTGALRDNPGRIALCEGGTLCLDEIGDIPMLVQPKLLRFIQDREYERVGDPHTRKANVRLIAATNTDLTKAVKQGRFREDLYYRLNVIRIEIPPLRMRSEDIELLAEKMLAFFCRNNRKALFTFTQKAIQALKTYSWPGNIRELRNVIERAVILCPTDRIGVNDLPETMQPHEIPVRLGDPVPLAKVEELHIRRIMTKTSSLQEAADILGIDLATLWRRRKTYGI